MRTFGKKLMMFLPILLILTSGSVMAYASDNPSTAKENGGSLQRCSKKQGEEKRSCYDDLFAASTTGLGVKGTMALLMMLGDLDRDVEKDGHVYAHTIGIRGYRAIGNFSRAFADCTELYQSGCYHGVLQAYLEQDLTERTAGDPAFLDGVCQPYKVDRDLNWLLFQCLHGLGHGLTTYYDHDLPKALDVCGLLSLEWDRRSCYGGAFMENIIHFTAVENSPGFKHNRTHGHGHHHVSTNGASAGDTHSTGAGYKGMDPGDPFFPCSGLHEKYAEDCYLMQTSVILHYNHGNIEAAAKVCDTAPRAMRPYCHQSLGRDISSYTLRDIPESVRLCSFSSPAYQPWCYIGLVKNFIDVTAKTDEGFALCRAAPGYPNKSKCYESVGEQIWILKTDASDRAASCQDAEPEYRIACRFGARVEN